MAKPPSKYRPELCQLVEDRMAQGYSLAACAGFCDIDTSKIYSWVKNYRAFKAAVDRGNAKRLAHWEGVLLTSKNPISAIFALKNIRPSEWKDRPELPEGEGVRGLDTLAVAVAVALAGGAKVGRAKGVGGPQAVAEPQPVVDRPRQSQPVVVDVREADVVKDVTAP